ncbi:tyrosine-type recombinase/integrase [Aeromonas hydrophila]|uniref:tyrosine-type recombinase/integrase n=1 Tax=Aeromonas hydrophila TaxID=644 RepID=UPI00216738E0|nr:tyrosine-type recombinase/integrase [Aeromonas hydrophila]
MKAYAVTVSDKWDALTLLNRLLLARGYGEDRALAVIAECEQRAQRGPQRQTSRDWMDLITDVAPEIEPDVTAPVETPRAVRDPSPEQLQVEQGPTLGQVFERFLQLRLPDWKTSTTGAYKTTLAKLNALGLASLPVADLKRSTLDTTRQGMINDDGGMKAGSVNLVFRHLCQALREVEQVYGEDEGLDFTKAIKHLTGLKPLKDESKAVDRAWPVEAVTEVSAKLADKMNSPHLSEANRVRRTGAYWQLWLSLATGCRKGEAEALRKGDIVREDSLMGIHIKGTKSKAADRMLPLVDGLNGFNLSEFEAYLETLPSDDTLLCGGGSLENLSKTERAAFQMSNGDGLTIHGLRHTAATTLATLGLDPVLLSQFMGHAQAVAGSEVTQRYITGAIEARKGEWLKLHEAIEPLVRDARVSD